MQHSTDKPTDQQIEEIAELLECGFQCYFHKPTGTIENYPDPEGAYFDSEPWQEEMDKVAND